MVLETSRILFEELFNSLEEFVCDLFIGSKKKLVHFARWEMFHRKAKKEHKVFDISMLPPCKFISYQTGRSNYILCLWPNAINATAEMPDINNHDWFPDHVTSKCLRYFSKRKMMNMMKVQTAFFAIIKKYCANMILCYYSQIDCLY